MFDLTYKIADIIPLELQVEKSMDITDVTEKFFEKAKNTFISQIKHFFKGTLVYFLLNLLTKH